MTFRIEQAQPTDAEAIGKILSNWIDETDWMPRIHTPEEDLGFGRFLLEKTDVLVARADGKVAGFLARRKDEIDALYLARDARRAGIGTALLNAAKGSGSVLHLWTFQANRGARAFYAKNGFDEIELTDGHGNDEKLPDVRMRWEKGAANV